MQNYSQRDSRWGGVKLGTSNYTIASQGCVITSLGNLTNQTPVQVNTLLRNNNGFANRCLVIWSRAAQLLGLRYDPSTSSPKFYPCVAETMLTSTQQHFFILLENGKIIDPLDGREKSNPYRIKSYRNIGRVSTPPVTPPPPPAASWPRLVRVIEAANVRSQPRVSAPLAGSKTLRPGDVFTGVELVDGDVIGGNKKWVKSSKGNFVWSGNLSF